jgi:hypothetical protein
MRPIASRNARGSLKFVEIRKAYWRVFPLFVALVAGTAAADDAAWKSKSTDNWTETDARDFLADSPWVKTFEPVLRQQQTGIRRGLGGIGLGIPGIGGIGPGGMGYPGGGYPPGGYPPGGYPPAGGYPPGGYPNGGYPNGGNPNGGSYPNSGQSTRREEPPKVTLRWESAMPVRTAEIKVHDNDAPTLDNEHYAIAVYGVPSRLLNGDTTRLEAQLKGRAAIKRDGKKDIKPSSVEVLNRPDGPVIVYLFPMKAEISKDDHRLEFNADIGRLELTQSFFTQDMVWQGKLEL